MMHTQEIIDRYQRYVIPTYAPALALVRGRGSKVWDADGKVYLDFAAGIAVNALGHGHPRVLEALRRQAETLIHVSNLYYNLPQARLAEKLSGLASGGKCFFCNSGAEANEALIKLARWHGHAAGRFEIVSMRNSFHGRTLGTMAATGQERIREGFEPMPSGFVYADFNDLESVRKAVTPATAAILLEAVQGEGGVQLASPEFLRGVRTLCDQHGLLLLCDEVQCGMGRTGKWFGFEHAGVIPDAFALAKALGGGYPVGAVVARPELADRMQPGKHASTFGGSPLACAVSLAVLETIEAEGLVARAAEVGKRMMSSLQALAGRFERVRAVRGLGLMIGVELDRPVKAISDLLTDMGLLTVAGHGNVMRLLPPLTIRDAEIDEALEMIEDALSEWHGMAANRETVADDAG